MPPRAPAKIKNFLIGATDRFLIAYYAKGVNDYADIAIMVNGIIKKGSYDVQVAEDGLLLSWRWASRSKCFDKEILKKTLGDEYRDSSHRVVAWDLGRPKDGDARQESALQTRPFWGCTDGGAPQMEVHRHTHRGSERLPHLLQGEGQVR